MQGVDLIRFVFPLDPSYSMWERKRRWRKKRRDSKETTWDEPMCSTWRLMTVRWQERHRRADGVLEQWKDRTKGMQWLMRWGEKGYCCWLPPLQLTCLDRQACCPLTHAGKDEKQAWVCTVYVPTYFRFSTTRTSSQLPYVGLKPTPFISCQFWCTHKRRGPGLVI